MFCEGGGTTHPNQTYYYLHKKNRYKKINQSEFQLGSSVHLAEIKFVAKMVVAYRVGAEQFVADPRA